MKTCIIHIGMHKTGSTSIQESLQGFYNDNFYYANLGASNHSVSIYCLFSENPKIHHHLKILTLEQIDAKKAIIRQKLIKSIEEAENRILLISGEDISLLSKEGLLKLKNFLKSYGYTDIKIMGYIRKPHEFISSSFQQILKAKFIDLSDLEKCYPNYKRFEKFYIVYGEENVVLKIFDQSKFPKGDVVRDFCQTFGIDFPEERIKRLNESFLKEIVSLIYILRKYKNTDNIKPPQIQQLGQYLQKILKGLELTKFRIDGSLIKPIIEKNIEDIKWMEQKLGESLIKDEDLNIEGIKTEEELLNVREDVLDRLIEESGYKKTTSPTYKEIAEMLLKILTKIEAPNKLMAKVMKVEPDRIAGWAFIKGVEIPVLVKLYINGVQAGEDVANRLREGLKTSGVHSTGRCGFLFKLPNSLSPEDNVEIEYIIENNVIKRERIKIG